MIYLDSCVVIQLIEADDRLRRSVRESISPYLAHGIAISELTRLECRVHPMAHQQSVILKQYDIFFSQPEIRSIPFSVDVWELATRLRAQYALKTPDALHLAAASHGRCKTFCTCDRQLARAAEQMMNTLIPTPLQGDDDV
ncbi:MAG: type II toxin-antitoxin system VapC family toxin [Mariprofundales bacterium]|nr:type II toxin-antitoxin system VapC family toxin [Mariprofundales bacterium]